MPRNKYHDTPVVEFHEAFGAPVAWTPTVPPADRRKLRLDLILEELMEFAAGSGFAPAYITDETGKARVEFVRIGEISMLEVADALADLRYVVDGASIEWGVPLEKCLREVHRSNMSKLGADGKPILREDGKILKGPAFELPRLDLILDLHGSLPQ